MASASEQITTALSSLWAPPRILSLLEELHKRALAEEPFLSTDSHDSALEKFVALDPDKSALVYLLLRASGARNVIEAGTSYGLSTIYLALAVSQNAKGGSGKVIATELEASKAKVAREHWKRAGSEIENTIELREGDILRTLDTDMPPIDFLLLDIWCVLALPIVKLLHSKLRPGAMIVADNTIVAKAGYSDLMEYLNDKANGFRLTQAPYTGGLMIAVYDPQR